MTKCTCFGLRALDLGLVNLLKLETENSSQLFLLQWLRVAVTVYIYEKLNEPCLLGPPILVTVLFCKIWLVFTIYKISLW